MNTPISFELAKLLKEKGYNEDCSDYYTSTGGLNSNGWGDVIYEQGFSSGEPDRMLRFNYSDFNKHQKETCFLCPTIAEVVMWLYEKHGIWTEVHGWTNQPVGDELWKNCFQAFVNGDAMNVSIFKKPTEAYEAAIEYTLNNLI